MTNALLFKEWKKTKWFVIGAFIVGAALLTYIFLRLGRSFRMVGMEHLWDVVINRDQFLLRELKYFPLAAGIAIAFSQFVPEVIQKRIKLSLHLPLSNKRVVFTMMGYGLSVLSLVYLLHILAILIFMGVHFPLEFIISALYTLAPWYVAGLMAYVLLAWICLEPSWKRRIFNALIMFGVLQLCFLSDFPGAYAFILFAVILLPIYILPFGYRSVERFKIGIQD
ncbi:hypothetical protein L3073_02840 [Ancylomarina sp. DW003]|nr:hypothetical protein [Ancylomarina sp. DW003]MDE5421139.1 hypothetical protein [Ancylomarina sp. DW003]